MPVLGTCSGRLFNPAFGPLGLDGDGSPDIVLQECFHAISLLCRYGGHTDIFYSVGQHTLIMESFIRHAHELGILAPHLSHSAIRKMILLHDAHEAYIVDLPRPIKKMLPEYSVLEKQIQYAMNDIFGLLKYAGEPEDKVVNHLDLAICEFYEIPEFKVGTESACRISKEQGISLIVHQLAYNDVILPDKLTDLQYAIIDDIIRILDLSPLMIETLLMTRYEEVA